MIANGLPSRFARIERLGELFVEARTVGQLGEHVEIGQAVDLLDRARAFGRVLDRSRHADDATVIVGQCLRPAGARGAARRPCANDAQVHAFRFGAARELDQPASESAAVVADGSVLWIDAGRGR